MRQRLAQRVTGHQQHFLFLDEIIFWYTESISFVKVKFDEPALKSRYSGRKTAGLVGNLSLFYSTIPLKLMSWAGLVVSIVSFVVGVYFILKKLFFNVDTPGYTSLIVAISFSTSIILLCFGILGQYLGNIYKVLNRKPAYHVREEEL